MKKLIIILIITLILSWCANQPSPTWDYWFYSWVLHGFTITFSLILSIFLDIRIYQFPNSWFSYDLWFFIWFTIWVSMISNINKKSEYK